MGRNVKIRANYTQDAIFLSRLRDAVEQDPKITDKFRYDTMAYIDKLLAQFQVEYNANGKLDSQNRQASGE